MLRWRQCGAGAGSKGAAREGTVRSSQCSPRPSVAPLFSCRRAALRSRPIQFLYSPPWATPSVLAAYNWKDCNFSFTRWWPLVSCRHFWLWRVPENLVSGWMVWIPAVSMIYILPASLQIPLFNIVLCFWSLVLTLITAV